MADGSWSVAEAKAKLSELIDKAKAVGPQHVTRNGKEAVVIVSSEEWRRRTRSGRSVVEVLLDPAVRGILKRGEEKLFERDRTDNRTPIEF